MRVCAARFIVVLLLLGVVFSVVSASAVARIVHHKEGSFNGSDAPGGQFGVVVPSDAVDQSTGDVYVLESNAFGLGRGVVDKFDGKGVYAGVQITGEVTPQKAFTFGFGSGVAVDNTAGVNKGDVYVADTEHGVVDRFNEAGEFLCQITGTEPVSLEEQEHECNGATGSKTVQGSIIPEGIAVDAAGIVYVADDAHGVIDRFGPAGNFLGQIEDPHLTSTMSTIALDPAGNLYVATGNFVFSHESSHVVEFNSSGEFALVLDGNPNAGVGVDPVTGHVLVADENAQSQTELAEYESSGALLGVTPVSVAGGLAIDGATGTVYETELIGAGFGPASVQIFGPDIVLPDVSTTPATGITETSATLNGHLDPDTAHGGGEITECVFEYGTTTFYGSTAPCSPGAPYASPADVSADVSALTRNTTYHFRLKVTNANGSSEGEDETFSTAGVPVIDSESARVSGRNATLTAQINPFGTDTTCQVQYVDDASFQNSKYASATTLPCTPEDLGSSFDDQDANATIKELQIATTYHYRFIAANQAGLSGAPDQTFSTFGANTVKFEVIDKEGLPFTQAAGHPYEVRASFKINPTTGRPSHPGEPFPTGNVKDVVTKLPAGLIGNPSAIPKCTREQLHHFKCSGASQVGVIHVEDLGGDSSGGDERESERAVYNLVPPKGVAAEFGFRFATITTVYLDARLRSDGDYGVTVESSNATTLAGVTEVDAHFWGIPAGPNHDAQRSCSLPSGEGEIRPCSAEQPVLKPFLRNPTSCEGPLTTTLALDSWQDPGVFTETSFGLPAITGCDKLSFSPSLQIQPTTSVADSPTGLHVDLHVPQNEDPEGLAEADLKDTRVTLPGGLTTNPAAANGLGACSPGQVGLTSAPGVSPVMFTSDPADCPDAAKIGTVEVDTPLLDHPLPGAVYLSTPYENPFNSLLAIYITIHDPVTGVVVKLAGHVEADPVTGQLTTTFSDSPQVPFEDFKLDFFSGARAALATPETCGTFTTTSSLTPWSGSAPVGSSEPEPFQVSSGCVNGFSPFFTAGSTGLQAGSYAPFALSFSRSDTDQEISGLSVTLAPGLLARIAGVTLCSDADLAKAAANPGATEAANPSCPVASQVGTVRAGAGAGTDPFFLPGKAYLTGPYNGGPYGLAVIVPALAGPFDLGTVVVRQSLRIDPHTAQVTAVSDPLPTILKGIPVRLRRVDATIDRPGFTFNPTSCDPLAITGVLSSTGGLSAAVSSRFQAGNCGALPFKPSFRVSTRGKTSKANGASLTVKVSQKPGEAHIHKVSLRLPLALPSRLTTLQKACTEAQFNTNPAGCPQASNIGTATAITPVLTQPLTGPAYLVSHGGAAFPDVEFVLHSEGIQIILDGKTDIKKGATYSTFETIPDAPITSFETILPQGPHSVLTTNIPPSAHNSLCTQKLTIPTTITGQNGHTIHQNTKITTTGCPKHKHKHIKKTSKHNKKHAKKH